MLFKTVLLEPFRWVEAVYVHVRNLVSKQESPVAPIFVLGFYRSGTTWLQDLLSCDPQFKTPTLFQVIYPEINLFFGKVLKPISQFFSKKMKVVNPYHRVSLDWDFPSEDDVAINSLFYMCDFNRIFQYPNHADRLLKEHFTDADEITLKEWKKAHRYFVQKLGRKDRHKRWVFKSPPNTGRIQLLKSMYPDAKFIFLKRDPMACIHSNKRLWKLNKDAYSLVAYDEAMLEEVIIKKYKVMHEHYLNERHLLTKEELVEVSYDRLLANPEQVLEQIYSQLGIEDNEVVRTNREVLISSKSDYKTLKHDYSEELQEKVNRALSPIMEKLQTI